MDRFTILGGSSPYTISLIDALRSETSLPPHELVLNGRNQRHLDLVCQYATSHLTPLGWKVITCTDLREALNGARFILHQVRYGGLEGRAEDEQLALEFGSPADETLGPAGLSAALRMAPRLRAVAATIVATAPRAWVLNLTNPLSIAVSILAAEGVTRCIGLCELPLTTASKVASLLDVPLDSLIWRYRGLNHRGFIVRLERDEVDLIPSLTQRLGKGSIGGIPAGVIAELGAVPTKYFRLMQPGSSFSVGRAAFVRELRHRILKELQSAPHKSPPSLRQREITWYKESVVPTLTALHTTTESRLVVNLPDEDGITREVNARVATSGITPEPPVDAPPRVQDHLRQFDVHERRVLEAVNHPSPARIEAALAADPTVKPSTIPALTVALWHRRGKTRA